MHISVLFSSIATISMSRLYNTSYEPASGQSGMTPTHRLFSSLSKTMATPRSIQKVFLAREQSEGAGARIRRSIGTAQMPELSPFLMLDHFKSTSLAGFPDHPHRGQGKLPFPTRSLNIASINLVPRIYDHVLIPSRNNYLPN